MSAQLPPHAPIERFLDFSGLASSRPHHTHSRDDAPPQRSGTFSLPLPLSPSTPALRTARGKGGWGLESPRAGVLGRSGGGGERPFLRMRPHPAQADREGRRRRKKGGHALKQPMAVALPEILASTEPRLDKHVLKGGVWAPDARKEKTEVERGQNGCKESKRQPVQSLLKTERLSPGTESSVVRKAGAGGLVILSCASPVPFQADGPLRLFTREIDTEMSNFKLSPTEHKINTAPCLSSPNKLDPVSFPREREES
ncbi:PREDICTED: uncharacterized protein LOC102020433 [Chinchilla lanigera]|uniref:uncharacterized protein LOC102020433 n=1 Tax=Chinchilla lanigera TaxID=34839 RepID=UPI00038EA14A|nr:PREDICTED: uncharacterized protein LOC102020433 [Chinchilla lanigera]